MSKTTALFEMGLEEMPARFLNDTEKQLVAKTKDWLKNERLNFDDVKTFVTPRRLAVLIEGLASKQLDLKEEAKGPQVKIAKDGDGNWTKAAIGFAKGQGQTVEAIYTKELKGVEYIYVDKFTEGKEAEELLPNFKSVFLSLNFPKNMRWGSRDLRFIRPIKWLVALNNETIVPFEIEGVSTSNVSRGHRFLGEDVTITSAKAYEETLENQFVIADVRKRKAKIVEQIEQLMTEKNWVIEIDQSLLEEVTQLVEYPTVFFGSFSQAFLTVPEEALITSMKEHQRYFPVKNQSGQLEPHFIAVRNGNDQHIDTVARGNEKVLNARLKDAVFFYEEDQKQSIESNLEKLKRMVFQEKLGTLHDKASRVKAISRSIALALGLDDETTEAAARAAEISKFDLVTQMVNEFTNLQGIMGEKYARLQGEKETVALAINEQYMPRSANGELPNSVVGQILSVSEKMDTIVGCLAVGLVPTGSQDPYALRRQAMAVVQMLDQTKWTLSFEALLDLVIDHYQSTAVDMPAIDDLKAQVNDFFIARIIFLAKEKGIERDVIQAIVTEKMGQIHEIFIKARLLEEKRVDGEFKSTQEALVRALNLAKKANTLNVDPARFENSAETALFEKVNQIKKPFEALVSEDNYNEALDQLAYLGSKIDAFFEETMVMVEDQNLKNNRLAILAQIKALTDQIADLTVIEWKQSF